MRHVEYQRIVINTFRYYPPICALAMLHHVIALIFGYDTALHEFLVDGCLIACVMQWLLSVYFHFCNWHRACIIYNYIVSVCIDYQREFDMGQLRYPMRYIVITIGLIILIMFSINCRNNNNETHNTHSA